MPQYRRFTAIGSSVDANRLNPRRLLGFPGAGAARAACATTRPAVARSNVFQVERMVVRSSKVALEVQLEPDTDVERCPQLRGDSVEQVVASDEGRLLFVHVEDAVAVPEAGLGALEQHAVGRTTRAGPGRASATEVYRVDYGAVPAHLNRPAAGDRVVLEPLEFRRYKDLVPVFFIGHVAGLGEEGRDVPEVEEIPEVTEQGGVQPAQADPFVHPQVEGLDPRHAGTVDGLR